MGLKIFGDKQIDMSNWRKKSNPNKVKFDDETKTKCLNAFLRWGYLRLAAKASDVCEETVRKHLANDRDFAEAMDAAQELRAEAIVAQIEQEALEGHTQPIFNMKTGELLGEKRVYETKLREMLLKRYEARYQDKSSIDITGTMTTGVLVAPEQLTMEELREKLAILRKQQREAEEE